MFCPVGTTTRDQNKNFKKRDFFSLKISSRFHVEAGSINDDFLFAWIHPSADVHNATKSHNRPVASLLFNPGQCLHAPRVLGHSVH